MINYRNIFNPNYNYIGAMIIFTLIAILIIIEKDKIKTLYEICKTITISSITILLITIIINFTLEYLIIGTYKIFIEVIMNNLIKNLYLYSFIILIISSISSFGIKFFIKIKEK